MKISESALTSHASSGTLTLQIPDTVIVFDHNHPAAGVGGLVHGVPKAVSSVDVATDVIDVPNDWFCHLRHNIPVVGRGSGFLYLTRKGFEANKDKLRAAYMAWSFIANLVNSDHPKYNKSSPDNQLPEKAWQKFEEEAGKHFAEVEKELAAAIKRTEKRLAQFRAIIV